MDNVRFLSAARIFIELVCAILALSSVVSAVAQPRHVEVAAFSPVVSSAAASAGRASILVRVKPRADHGNGDAVIFLMDGEGVLRSFEARVGLSGLAQGVNGPSRMVQNGDTPFGVYKYTSTNGGLPRSILGPGFGTGKINVDDNDVFGEVKEAGRSLIRLHGGGSRLLRRRPPEDPYAPDQMLLPTFGCVRMKNGDVNALIGTIKDLPAEASLEFIFIGSQKYLIQLATDPTLSAMPWQEVLQTDLRLIPPSPAQENFLNVGYFFAEGYVVRGRSVGGWQTPVQISDAELLELVTIFSEDVGERGQEAWNRLRSHPDLIAALRRIQEALPPDSRVRPRIAFVLCNLGHNYEANKRVIKSAFDATPPYRGFYPDEAEAMISRLIDKNDDAELLRTLFTATPRADGALSEGLSVTFSEKLRDKTRWFVSTLKNEPEAIRLKVGRMISTAGYLTKTEIAKIKRTLQQIKNTSLDLKDTVLELLSLPLWIVKRGR